MKKARQLADKQKRLKATQEKREERRKRAEAEKIRKEKKKREKERMKVKKQKRGNMNKATNDNSCERRNEKRRNVKRASLSFGSGSSLSNDENICSVCLEDNPWVLCDMCNLWMHIE